MTTFITGLRIQNDSVSLHQKISSQLLSYTTVTSRLPFYYRYPLTALIYDDANYTPTTSLVTNPLQTAARMAHSCWHWDLIWILTSLFERVTLVLISSLIKGLVHPFGSLGKVGVVTPVSTCNAYDSTCHDSFQPLFDDRRIPNMQHSAPSAATYINGPIYTWAGDVQIGNWDGRWIHSRTRASSHLWARVHRYWPAMLAVSAG